MNSVFTHLLLAVMGVTVAIADSVFIPQNLLAQVTSQQTIIQLDPKSIPIAIHQVRVSIPPKTLIGEATTTVFRIVQHRWYTENLSNSDRFINRVVQALEKAGFTAAQESKSQQNTASGSIFDITANNEVNTQASPQARFLVGATITKAWMTARPDGWGSMSSDVDMKVTWEVYDTLQNKVILTQETYAVDEGGGQTEDYFYTVMEIGATKFFRSSEFERALEQSLRDFPYIKPSPPDSTPPIQGTVFCSNWLRLNLSVDRSCSMLLPHPLRAVQALYQ